MDSVVSVTRLEKNVDSSVRRAIDRVGGMASVVEPGETIYLKPNFVAPRASSHGVTTDFEIIRVVADEVLRCGGRPIIFETPAIEFDKRKVYQALGVYDFTRLNNIPLIENFSDLIKIPVPGGKVFRSLRIPRILDKAKIINLPKLKTHVSAKMTCAMKNLIGLLPDSEKRRVHIRGVSASIADLGRVFKPILTVVDAMTCLEGDGPTYGNKVDLGLIISGRNMVSVDKVCSQIIGLPWQEVKYIDLGDGSPSQENVHVVGEPVEEVKTRFDIPQKSVFFHLGFRLIYTLDVVFSKIFSKPFNRFLYSTGHVGTNPKILRERCDRCGDCIEACPFPSALNIEGYKVNYKSCIRCLECYLACKREAISLKGISKPRK